VSPSAVRTLAPAKVNPRLVVLGRRPDGFHAIDTTMLALDWCDVVEVARADEPAVRVTGPHASPDVPADERNLAWRAAAVALERARASGRGAGSLAISIEKHVPSRAGLGGGSSDAAAALLAAVAVLELDVDERWITGALARLGSDCAFFAAAPAGWARCTGRGEHVEPLAPAPPADWVVVVPAVECPTSDVYRALEFPLSAPPEAPTVDPALSAASLEAARASLFNHLEDAALAAVPGLATIRDWLDAESGAHFRLSGSGSSFFGLFPDPNAAADCAQRLGRSAERRGLALRACRSVRSAGHGARPA